MSGHLQPLLQPIPDRAGGGPRGQQNLWQVDDPYIYCTNCSSVSSDQHDGIQKLLNLFVDLFQFVVYLDQRHSSRHDSLLCNLYSLCFMLLHFISMSTLFPHRSVSTGRLSDQPIRITLGGQAYQGSTDSLNTERPMDTGTQAQHALPTTHLSLYLKANNSYRFQI